MVKLTEEQKLERRLLSRFHKAIKEYSLIEENDSILIGVSGGKDSIFLMEMLGKKMKRQHPKFTLHAVHIRMSNISYETNTDYLTCFADKYGIKLHVVETSFTPMDGSKKTPCFLCSWNRRKQLFTLAQQLGCNKIALGHHQDDIIHTSLMNLTFQGHFATMPVKLKMKKMPLTIIRPLCLEEEKDILEYARLSNYEKQKKLCPFEKDTNRSSINNIFSQIGKINPEARYSFWNALNTDNKLIEGDF